MFLVRVSQYMAYVMVAAFLTSCSGSYIVDDRADWVKDPCDKLNQDDCKKAEIRCFYNIDHCRDKFKVNEHGVPEGLGKAKKIAVGDGVLGNYLYVIDMNDQLWGVPRNTYSEKSIYPHASKTYSDVAATDSRACAVKKNGEIECFNRGESVKGAPKGTKAFTSVNVNKDGDACAVDVDGGIGCYSHDGWLEKLAQNLGTFMVPVVPIKQVALVSAFAATPVAIAVFSGASTIGGAVRTDTFIQVEKDAGAATGGKNLAVGPDGRAFVTVSENGDKCLILTTKKLICDPSLAVPAALAGDNFVGVSRSNTHVCAIKETNNELVCWGNKRHTNGIPANLTGVKAIAVDAQKSCYIDKDDKVNCHKAQD